MPIPTGRTSDEESVYLILHPCSCGEDSDLDGETVTSRPYEGVTATVREGGCHGCGKLRTFVFGPHPPSAGRPATMFGAAGSVSELIDPAEWFAYGILQALSHNWDIAADAIAEAGRFVPAGRREPPAEAFASVDGRRIRERAPGVFDVVALADRSRAYTAERLVGDEQHLPRLVRGHAEWLARNTIRDVVMRRFTRFTESGDPAYVLGDDAELEMTALLGPGAAADPIAVVTVAHLRWSRYRSLPPPAGRADLVEALRHFDAQRASYLAGQIDVPPAVQLLLEHADVG